MKVLSIIGTGGLGEKTFVAPLVEALKRAGLSVSCVKRAPDGFDIDQPGKASFLRRAAGSREVMLVGDQRFVLMREFGMDAQPTLDALLARLETVDLAIVEGFHGAALPTVEFFREGRKRPPLHERDPNIIAVVCEKPLAIAIPTFTPDDMSGLAGVVAERLGLRVSAG